MAFLMGIIHLLTNVQTFVCHTMTNFLKHLYTWSSQTFIKLFLQIVGQAGPGLVQILCCWTPMRRLGISKRHFTGWKLVIWGWFMYIFINLSVIYVHLKFFIVFSKITTTGRRLPKVKRGSLPLWSPHPIFSLEFMNEYLLVLQQQQQ